MDDNRMMDRPPPLTEAWGGDPHETLEKIMGPKKLLFYQWDREAWYYQWDREAGEWLDGKTKEKRWRACRDKESVKKAVGDIASFFTFGDIASFFTGAGASWLPKGDPLRVPPQNGGRRNPDPDLRRERRWACCLGGIPGRTLHVH